MKINLLVCWSFVLCFVNCADRSNRGSKSENIEIDFADTSVSRDDTGSDILQNDFGSIEVTPPPECMDARDCDDKVDCTQNACSFGVCTFHANVDFCDDASACTTDVCNLKGNVFGGCEYEQTSCDDGDAETLDVCDETSGCYHTKTSCENMTCNDNVDCTIDTCLDAQCVFTPHPASCLDDANVCLVSVCDSKQGCMLQDVVCNDNNPTTMDVCDENSGCVYTEIEIVCDTSEQCEDNDGCTTSVCTPQHTCLQVAKKCDDNLACTDDGCLNGECVFTESDCDDQNECTIDLCLAAGCTTMNIADGTSCDDDNFCTVDSTCQNGVCDAGSINLCDDGLLCTEDLCDSVVGCTHKDNSKQCAAFECMSQDIYGCEECNLNVGKKCPVMPAPITSQCLGFFNPPPVTKSCQHTAGGYGSGVGWVCLNQEVFAGQTLDETDSIIATAYAQNTIQYHVGYAQIKLKFEKNPSSGAVVDVSQCACIDFSGVLHTMTVMAAGGVGTLDVVCKK